MKKVFVAIVFLSCMLASCQTKQSAISDLRGLSNELQMYGDSYTLNDWKNAGKRYVVINKRIAKHTTDYSDQEVQEISELNGKCARSFSEGAINKVQGAANAINSFIKGFLK